jgi:hypothetical protein
MSQDEIKNSLEQRATELMLEGRQYAAKKQSKKDLGPFKFNQVMLSSINIFPTSLQDIQLCIRVMPLPLFAN